MDFQNKFSFPFAPYSIQIDFMEALYDALDNRKLGIFESPTGTGKSLSIICGALTWLKDFSERNKEELGALLKENVPDNSQENGDWFSVAVESRKLLESQRQARQQLDRVQRWETKISNMRKKKHDSLSEKLKWTNFREICEKDEEPEELELLLDDYESDVDQSDDCLEETHDEGCLKIFYCSRTHSQLSQFLQEVQKTEFNSNITAVPLASRHNLCINDAVINLNNISLMNEKCLELQEKKGQTVNKDQDANCNKKRKTSSGCPYRAQNKVKKLSEQIFQHVQDLEEIVIEGKIERSCPYYATRECISDAQLVVLPYQSILHKATREANNIILKNNVVIVDEAHNLLETIGNIHAVLLTSRTASICLNQLNQYLQKYENRLSAKNILNLRQIIFFVKSVLRIMKPRDCKQVDSTINTGSRMITQHDFLCETYTDNLNLFKLVRYIEKSKLAHKLYGFSKRFSGLVSFEGDTSLIGKTYDSTTSKFLSGMLATKEAKTKTSNTSKDLTENARLSESNTDVEMITKSPLLTVTELLNALGGKNSDGRIVIDINNNSQDSSIKYVLMNPATQFHELVRECRSVIVAGGTMSPMSEFREQLFLSAGASLERVCEFSFDHVVERKNILPLCLTHGPTGALFDFTYRNRSNPKLLDELGRVLSNLANIIPGGIVCFLPSYEYENKVYEHLDKGNVLAKISIRKMIFREPKQSSELGKTLADFDETIRKSANKTLKESLGGLSGALLFSVVGGKMSEGINFNDDLARCVLMVGLPYPNSKSIELQEKIDYLSKHYQPDADGRSAGTVFYESLCFKAVNQSIGRSIRHKNDYASIILLDQRYSSNRVRNALPRWIRTQTKLCQNFGQAFGYLRKFFEAKKMERNVGNNGITQKIAN